MSRPSTKVISVEQQQQQQVSTGSAKPTIANTALAAGFAIRWQNAALSAQLQQEKAHNERLRMEVAMQEELQQTHFSMVDGAFVPAHPPPLPRPPCRTEAAAAAAAEVEGACATATRPSQRQRQCWWRGDVT